MTTHTDRHILIVVENLPVPLDRRVWLEATTLARAGYEVSVISPMGRGWDATYEVIEGVHIYRYTLPVEAHSGVLAYAQEYGHAIWQWYRLAKKVWKRRRFDAIQGCNPPDLVFLLALLYRHRSVKYMFDHHDVSPELFEAKFGKRGVIHCLMCVLERITFRVADVSMATNDSFRAIAMTRGKMDPSDVFTVRSAPKTEQFLPATGDATYRKGAETLVGYVGVIGQQEGMDLLVRAADHLVNALHKDVHFLIIGFGPARRDMMQDVTDRGLTKHFTFTGALYGPDLLDALNAIDIGVASDPKNTMNDISTMNKVMEYMTLEKPVVQFDLTEGRVSAGPASLYAKPNDPIDFAIKIETLIDNPALRRDMGKAGRNRVLDRLSWTHSEQSLLAAYARLFEK
ncbi:glycosyltransferase family 4 protein [uncultured Sulfitobacter sp.]|jgi:glycosyltransferase involved in cell wall biosynthesis|uniref:glycosyltransferase family 4 protein n=1 Tax=Sulfitobacter sp. SH22 TaxID=3421172 RepID=UPI0025D9AA64|nr:glycosyltransferase family 4 protein [uncultured Sulfitobacter sp.]